MKDISYNTAAFLSRITHEDQVRYFFVKQAFSYTKANVSVNQIGYFQGSQMQNVSGFLSNFTATAEGIYYSLNAVKTNCISRASNIFAEATRATSLHQVDIDRRELLLVDLDPLREPNCSSTDSEKAYALDLANRIESDLCNAGWPFPLIVDSGNGFHLLYRINLALNDKGLVKRCLHSLAGRYNNEHVKVDTGVFDPSRIAKLPGTWTRKGLDTRDRPHRISGFFDRERSFVEVPSDALFELASVESEKRYCSPPDFGCFNFSEASEDVLSRASAYLNKLEPAVSGNRGHDQFFRAACVLLEKFRLSRDQLKVLLETYNKRCIPPFSATEIEHKLKSALQRVSENGSRSNSKEAKQWASNRNQRGARFYGFVPDFGLVAKGYVMVPRSKALSVLSSVLTFILWKYLFSTSVIPDVFLRQVVYGAKHDRNWRKRIHKKLKLKKNLEASESQICTYERCMLYGSGKKHLHYRFDKNPSKFLTLSNFMEDQDLSANPPVPFRVFDEKFREKREELQKAGTLFNVYWPALILGSSPLVGWTWSQRRLVIGLVLELTRSLKKTRQGIVGESIKYARFPKVGNKADYIYCPLLNPKLEYVAFAGNGKRRFGGYRIVGITGKGWLHRCGYNNVLAADPAARMKYISSFFQDLRLLETNLSLVVAAVFQGQWKTLDNLIDCLKSEKGRKWLQQCNVRIFTHADWQDRWRVFFASKLGFSHIPRDSEDCDLASPDTHTDKAEERLSTNDVRRFLKQNKWSQKDLATKISEVTGEPCSVRRVERFLSGKSRSSSFIRDYLRVEDVYPSVESSDSSSHYEEVSPTQDVTILPVNRHKSSPA